MGEMDPAFEGTDHIGQIILQICSVGTGAEGDAVVRIVHHFHHAQNVGFVDDDSGQTEHAPCGIVRMNCHIDIVFVTDGHDALQKILQIFEELFIGYVLIHFKEFLDVRHALGFPAGKNRTVGVAAAPCAKAVAQ